jgi:predicted dehydrogenase
MNPTIAVIGAGYIGTNHARVIADCPRADLGVIVDVDHNRGRRTAQQFDTAFSPDISSAMDCNGAIVATTTGTHIEIALRLIDAGVPLLVEKPIATDLLDVELLCQAIEDRGVRLMCGFIERFNPVITAALSLLSEHPTHIVAIRHSPAAPRIMNSVVHDLLIHDLDLTCQFMSGEEVVRVGGTSWAPPGSNVAEIADCTLQFASGAIATLSSSRAGQRKLRSIQIGTPSMLLDLDLLRQDLTVYRNVRQEQDDDTLTYRAETIVDIPFVRHSGEPLALQLNHFLDLIDGRVNATAELKGILTAHRLSDQIAQSGGAPLAASRVLSDR